MFSKNFKSLREKNKLTQLQIAEYLNVTRSAISNWELGLRMPDANTLKDIAKFFNVTIEQLINDELLPDTTVVANSKKRKILNVIKIISVFLLCVINSTLIPFVIFEIDPTAPLAYFLIIAPISYFAFSIGTAFICNDIKVGIISCVISIIPSFLLFEYLYNITSFPGVLVYVGIYSLGYIITSLLIKLRKK